YGYKLCSKQTRRPGAVRGVKQDSIAIAGSQTCISPLKILVCAEKAVRPVSDRIAVENRNDSESLASTQDSQGTRDDPACRKRPDHRRQIYGCSRRKRRGSIAANRTRIVKGLLDSRLGKRILDPINIDPVIYFWGDRLCFNPYCGDTQEYQDADVAHMLCCSFTVMWFGFHYCWTGPT